MTDAKGIISKIINNVLITNEGTGVSIINPIVKDKLYYNDVFYAKGIDINSEKANFMQPSALIPFGSSMHFDSSKLADKNVKGITIGPIYKHRDIINHHGYTDIVLVDKDANDDNLRKRISEGGKTGIDGLRAGKVYLVDRSTTDDRNSKWSRWSCIHEFDIELLNGKIILKPKAKVNTLVANFTKGVIGATCDTDNNLFFQTPSIKIMPDMKVNWFKNAINGLIFIETDNGPLIMNNKHYDFGKLKEISSVTVKVVDINSKDNDNVEPREITGKVVYDQATRDNLLNMYKSETEKNTFIIAENILTYLYNLPIQAGQSTVQITPPIVHTGGADDPYYKKYLKYKKKYYALKSSV